MPILVSKVKFGPKIISIFVFTSRHCHNVATATVLQTNEPIITCRCLIQRTLFVVVAKFKDWKTTIIITMYSIMEPAAGSNHNNTTTGGRQRRFVPPNLSLDAIVECLHGLGIDYLTKQDLQEPQRHKEKLRKFFNFAVRF